MVRVRPLGFLRQNEKLVTRIVQAIHESAGGAIGVRATADLHEPVVNSHRHALIEDETFALPVLIPELLLVCHDAAVQLENILEPAAAQ